jgi:NitT/TauT family transport system permease protein
MRAIVLPTGVAVLFLATWEAVCVLGSVPKIILPPPADVWRILITGLPLIMQHAVPTFIESVAGFAIATVLGILIAAAITYSVLLREAFYPHLVLFQLVPKVALGPLFVVWLGIGPPSRLAFATFISFFPVVIATSTGLTQVPSDMVRLGRSLTLTKWQIFHTIRFPYALPYLFSGMKIAVTMAMIGVIVGEFIAAQKGLGFLILFAGAQSDTALILATIAVLCIIGFGEYGAVVLAENLVERWYGHQ